MRRLLRVPLAWLNLTHDRRRFALFSAGIGFAVVLMFVQYGCRNALLDANLLLVRHLRADLLLVSRRQATFAVADRFDRSRLALAGGAAGVRSVHPLYLEFHRSFLRNADRRESDRQPSQTIRVIGVDPDARLLDFPELDPEGPRSAVGPLKVPGHALFDRRSRPYFGPVGVGTETELAGRGIRVVGTFELGCDFSSDGSLVVSEDTFGRWLRRPYGEPEEVSLGLVRLEPGADRAAVQQRLRSLFAVGDVDVLTPEELMDREKGFWQKNTPVGIVFGFGMFMGFVVGLVICYQVLSSDVTDHLAEYATLKAIGYPDRSLRRVVAWEALLLAAAGFVPGLVCSKLIYLVLAWRTGLPMDLSPTRIAQVGALTVLMCVGAGLFSVRKLKKADPAEVF